ncbi:hypothetical protein CFter6_2630 [Collimonas fungivorans]|uniref:Uncharacterized protein n=1 Tax=Collimonas fungivorans TaxID=158899 RepID=A0A127PBZ2_9BURK|nr:hypothetical protein CFter6_2630 [Collimonas fungivorans]
MNLGAQLSTGIARPLRSAQMGLREHSCTTSHHKCVWRQWSLGELFVL